ncbi:MAG: UbiX family flavin prenyltransferase [Bacteroidales bacterium]|nr:UbiX family flavin prenyltransferase [Bacteroidales bacterium]
MTKKIVVGITGASGAIYAHLLLKKLALLSDQYERVDLVLSETAREVWKYELADELLDQHLFKVWDANSFWAPMASGSSGYDTMIIIPCTMGTMGRIASGLANDLITRSADVMLKERKKLILVTRETPLSLIHIRNMETITLAGGVICPANPSYYSQPKNIEDLLGTVVDRVLDLAGIVSDGHRWSPPTRG